MMLALVLTIGTSFAFTGEEAINKQALNAFKKEFAGATDAAWTVGNNFYKVEFSLNDQKLFAYYNSQGEFLAVTRNMALKLTISSASSSPPLPSFPFIWRTDSIYFLSIPWALKATS